VYNTETQRIRTGNKFLGPSGGHSESVFCSSVRKVSELIFLQTLQMTLKIDSETLPLSITVQDYAEGVGDGVTLLSFHPLPL
jgi:hypothetical protein